MYRYQCKGATKKAPLKKCVCLTANDLITPHPSQATPSPQATQGKARAKPWLRTVVLTASVDATRGTDKSVPYKGAEEGKKGRSVTAPMNNE